MKADLTAKEASVDADILGEWRRELRIVQRRRLRDVKVMDRYQAKKQISWYTLLSMPSSGLIW